MGSIAVVFFDLGETLVTRERSWLPGARALLASLRGRGVRLGIISNAEGLPTREAILAILPPDFDVAAFEPDLVLFSSELGVPKPRPEIFRTAVARAGIPASQCLYCSENVVETLVAQHVGMYAIRVQTAPHAELDAVERYLAELEAETSGDEDARPGG